MAQRVDNFTARRITFETSLQVDTVLERLDEELSKKNAGDALIAALRSSATRDEFEAKLHEINGGKDFVLFSAMPHSSWLARFTETDTPKTWLYTFGNPLIAQTMLTHDLYAGLHIPPRLLVEEKADRTGTLLIYIQPSSLIAVPVDGKVNEELKKAAEALDAKVEALMARITTV